MKGKLFIAALALLAVAACNKEGDGPSVKPELKGDQYMAVNLKMSGNPTTKAWDATAFEDATADEIAVSKVQFLFFKGEAQCADPFTPKEELTWGAPDHKDSDQKKADAIIVMKNPTDIPDKIVAILNYDKDFAKEATLANLKAEVIKDAANGAAKKPFVMSNSVYVDGGEVVIGTPVTEANICKSVAEALDAPVEIHVERVLAKVALTVADGIKNGVEATTAPEGETAGTPITANGKKIVVKIDGFWLDNTNSDATLIKSLAADALTGDDWWIDVPNFRSYWAIAAPAKTLNHGVPTDASMDAKYVVENTPDAKPLETEELSFINSNATQIVFATHLEVEGTTETVVKYQSTYYTFADWQTLIEGYLNSFCTKTVSGETTTWNSVKIADLDWTDVKTNEGDNKILNPDWSGETGTENAYGAGKYIEDWQAVITVKAKEGVTIYKKVGTAGTNDDYEEVKDFAKVYKVQYFLGGKSYFYKPIIHNSDLEATAKGYYGIVRNHLYRVNATKIYGLGTPISNPKQEIIPQKPNETESYIAAEIDVLKYKVVENNYILE